MANDERMNKICDLLMCRTRAIADNKYELVRLINDQLELLGYEESKL